MPELRRDSRPSGMSGTLMLRTAPTRYPVRMTSQGDETLPAVTSDVADRCARCGYDLRGVDDDRPCPECGLLAERSRGVSSHLSDATPRWLLVIALGTALILLAHVIAVGWLLAMWQYDYQILRWLEGHARVAFGNVITGDDIVLAAFDVAGLMLLCGAWLLTRPQRRARREESEDRWLRTSVRVAACVPLVAMAWLHVTSHVDVLRYERWTGILAMLLLTVGCSPLPALVFIYLRRLAQRVLHPGLAEHAAIVGVGFSVTLVATPAIVSIIDSQQRRWGGNSIWMLVLPLLITVSLLLFGGWSALNCVRFIAAFARAHRGARRKWAAADLGTSRDAA